jgi:hypothetical protein
MNVLLLVQAPTEKTILSTALQLRNLTVHTREGPHPIPRTLCTTRQRPGCEGRVRA